MQPSRADAQATFAGKNITLNIRSSAKSGTKHFGGWQVVDGSAHRTIDIPEAFVIILKDGSTLRSTAMQATAIPHPGAMANHCWSFVTQQPAASFEWCPVVKPGNAYARVTLSIKAGAQELPIREVHLLQFQDASARVDGSVKGSPVVSKDLFYGFEHPLSSNTVQQGVVDASLHRQLPLQSGQSITYGAVIGTSKPGQLRRAFLTYLENERPRRYKPFLHYNSWFDLGYTNRFDEAGALDRVHAFGTELVEKRKVQLDSYLFDDGWDDPNTLWGFDSGFPHGFTRVGAAASTYHAGIGVWLSPWGGYDRQKQERVAYGKSHGYEILNNGYALSGPRYYKQFEQTCLDMVDRYHVNQFKFDGTGNADRVFPGSAFDSDFDAAIHLIDRLRGAKPGLFINLTTGTTPSPFWLFYADSIWRGGEDHDFTGVGSPRQRWMTYRDGQTYRNIVQKGPLFPLNSLMLHGIIYAKSALDLTSDPKNEFADEVHSYFGSGTQLQEMYITPKLLTQANWDTLAEGARWSRAHAETLKDAHWIGGDPSLLQVYGWAAWSAKEGIVTLRNPSDHAQSFSLEIGQALELPAAAPGSYILQSVWASRPGGIRSLHVSKGQVARITLAPFEVVTLAGHPS
ncbi:enterotoxin [Acidipila sp. EB88]|uniref:enterotoxin n=1 Tax=Acidipila sp. EB88 TaxID=2305226 RepID=UPI000F603D10|nr:enterotoxin [Acidipila sp. EB88]